MIAQNYFLSNQDTQTPSPPYEKVGEALAPCPFSGLFEPSTTRSVKESYIEGVHPTNAGQRVSVFRRVDYFW